MKKVLIDARMVGPQLHGIARYVSLMARGLQLQGNLPYEPIFIITSDLPREIQSQFGFEVISSHALFLQFSELWEVPKILRKMNAALYHSPSFSSLFWSPCPWMMTVHDLNHLTYGNLAQRVYYRFLLKRFARKAKALLTVSEFSRREIADWLCIPNYSIEVVYNALDPAFETEVNDQEATLILARQGLEKGCYFLCLSNSKPHKNINFLIEAYQAFRKQQNGTRVWPLVLSMQDMESSPGVRQLGALPENEIKILLGCAGALVFPSLYEGFGLPSIEAASLGVPLLVSQIPAHQEALQDLKSHEVSWVNPRDFQGWVSALHRAWGGEISGPSRESQIRLRERYRIRRLGQDMDQIYRRVLGL